MFGIFVKVLFWVGVILPLLNINLFGFELSKILFLSFWISFGVVMMYSGLKQFKKLDKTMLILWLFMIVGMFFSSVGRLDSVKYVWGEPGRWQGLWFFFLLFVLYIEVSLYRFRIKYEMTRLVGTAWLVGAIGTVILGLWQKIRMSLGFYVLDYAGRVVSSVGQPNFWADYLLIGWVLVLFGDKFDRKTKHLSMITVLIGLWLSGSKLTLVVFGGLIFYWLRLKRIFAYLGLAFFGGLSMKMGWWEARLAIWQRVVEKIKLHPWFGYGLGNLYDVIGGVNLLRTDRAHNVLLDMWLIGGVGLMLVFLGLWFRGVILAKREVRIALVVWMILACIHVLGVLNWVWLAILLALSVNKGSVAEYNRYPAWQVLFGLAYGLVVLLGVLRGYSLVE